MRYLHDSNPFHGDARRSPAAKRRHLPAGRRQSIAAWARNHEFKCVQDIETL
jgi:hypothetical protein